MDKKLIIINSFLFVLILCGCSQIIKTKSTPDSLPRGTIFFIASRGQSSGYRSYLVSMPERSIQESGYRNYEAGYAISKDGNLLAMTCFDDNTKICIIDTSIIRDRTQYIKGSNDVGFGEIIADDFLRINIPQSCLEINEQTPKGQLPLHQMGWSYDHSKLSLVCGSKWEKSILCVLGLDGNSNCFPETTNRRITYAEWSPLNDTLAVSSTTYVLSNDPPPTTYLFDPNTEDFSYLFEGFSPAWSPDGNEITYFYTDRQNLPYLWGLKMYTFETKAITDILPNEQSKDLGFSLWADVPERNEDCTISWSPDKKYLIFSSHIMSSSFSTLLIYDFDNGGIQYLIDPVVLGVSQIYPQWSSFELEKKE